MKPTVHISAAVAVIFAGRVGLTICPALEKTLNDAEAIDITCSIQTRAPAHSIAKTMWTRKVARVRSIPPRSPLSIQAGALCIEKTIHVNLTVAVVLARWIRSTIDATLKKCLRHR